MMSVMMSLMMPDRIDYNSLVQRSEIAKQM